MIRWGLVVLTMVHGLIHLMGPARAFGWAELPALELPISRSWGVAWLVAALALFATAVSLALSLRYWWAVALVAVVCSQAVVIVFWSDAKVGTIANVVLLLAAAYGFASGGPPSFRAEYRSDVAARVVNVPEPEVLTEADLADLPDPVQRYLRITGAVGRPRAHHVRAAWRGRIRAGPDAPWMEFTAEQWNFVDEPARFFHMDARRAGLPVDVLHAYRDGMATMRVRLLSAIPLVDAGGADFTRAETVTVLNDLALLAPSALAGPGIRWESIDARSARARYRVGEIEVTAVLEFDETGELIDFVSDDRLAASPDGRTFEARRWSTPVGAYGDVDGLHLMRRGEARWHTPDDSWVYVQMELLDLQVNGGF